MADDPPADDLTRAEGRAFWLELIAERGQALRHAEGGITGVIEQALLCGATWERMAEVMGIPLDEFRRRYEIRTCTSVTRSCPRHGSRWASKSV